MTQAQRHACGVMTPSPFQLWLGTMLRVVVELVLNVASVVRMIASALSGECHTDVGPADLPEPTHDKPKETKPAEPNSQITNLEADEVRLPGEGRDPAITSILALPSGCSLRAEQALKLALGPGLRRDTDREKLRPS